MAQCYALRCKGWLYHRDTNASCPTAMGLTFLLTHT